jgi:Ras-related protein Rab-1A
LIGDSGVGKSSLILRFADDTFTENFTPTIGVDFKIKTVEIESKRIKMQIWDTAGQERFRTITSTYYRGAQGVIIVYDICDREGFRNISNWVSEIKRHCVSNVNIIVIGNKSDLEDKRVIRWEDGSELARSLDFKFIETSAKDSRNVEEAFLSMARDIKSMVGTKIPVEDCRNRTISGTPVPKKSCCSK